MDDPDIAAQLDTLPPITKVWGQAHLYKVNIDDTYLKTSISTLEPPVTHDLAVSDELTFEFKLAPKGKQRSQINKIVFVSSALMKIVFTLNSQNTVV